MLSISFSYNASNNLTHEGDPDSGNLSANASKCLAHWGGKIGKVAFFASLSGQEQKLIESCIIPRSPCNFSTPGDAFPALFCNPYTVF